MSVAFPRPGRFEAVMAAARRLPVPVAVDWCPGCGEAVELFGDEAEPMCGHCGDPLGPPTPPRFSLFATLDGYVIKQDGEVIATFHGPQWKLASSTINRLRAGLVEDAS